MTEMNRETDTKTQDDSAVAAAATGSDLRDRDYLNERDEETGEVLFVHSEECEGYCDYACNPDGEKEAARINMIEADMERQTHASIERGLSGRL